MARKLSIIVPAYNEGEGVRVAHDAIIAFFRSQLQDWEFELIFVDDGSRDDTFGYLAALAQQSPYTRVIRLAANCGSHMAIRAGLEHARGDLACFLACDLQDPPETISRMLEALVEPVEVVWAVRASREDGLCTRLLASTFYFVARLMVSKNLPPQGASMFLLGPRALKAVSLYKERNLTLEGLFATMGFPQAHICYERRARQLGSSKWTLGKRLKHFADFFVGYSYLPIRLISLTGMGIAALGFFYAAWVVLNRIFFGQPIEGWSSLMVVVLGMGGMQMVMLGVIGEYIWRTLDEARGRPRYFIEQIVNGMGTNHGGGDAPASSLRTKHPCEYGEDTVSGRKP